MHYRHGWAVAHENKIKTVPVLIAKPTAVDIGDGAEACGSGGELFFEKKKLSRIRHLLNPKTKHKRNY
jgi:hypothetical protein